MADLNDSNHWQLDKRVPVALVLMFLGQFAALVWWGRGIDTSVTSHEGRIVALEKASDLQRDAATRLTVQMESMQSQLNRIDRGTAEIEGLIRRLLEKP